MHWELKLFLPRFADLHSLSLRWFWQISWQCILFSFNPYRFGFGWTHDCGITPQMVCCTGNIAFGMAAYGKWRRGRCHKHWKINIWCCMAANQYCVVAQKGWPLTLIADEASQLFFATAARTFRNVGVCFPDVHMFSFQPPAIPSVFLLQIMFKTIGLIRMLPSLDQLQCMHLCVCTWLLECLFKNACHQVFQS